MQLTIAYCHIGQWANWDPIHIDQGGGAGIIIFDRNQPANKLFSHVLVQHQIWKYGTWRNEVYVSRSFCIHG